MFLLLLLVGTLVVGPSYSTPDLLITNLCNTGLWVEARQTGGIPLPGQSTTTTYLPAKGSLPFTIPDLGLPSTRFWAKFGCDASGANCLIGDQDTNFVIYPNGGCPPDGCQPAVDSLFEATWGCKLGVACPGGVVGTTWFDTSQVDGWTIPYKLLLTGDTQCNCGPTGCMDLTEIDATHLRLGDCPSGEDMSYYGQFSQYKSVDLRIIRNDTVVACNSPCKKFTEAAVQGGLDIFEGNMPAEYYCCPTPNAGACDPAAGCVTSAACRAGPISSSQYVKNVHKDTNGLIYAYSYDDLNGLHTCPSAGVYYEMQFCPPGSPPYPYPLHPGTSNSSGVKPGAVAAGVIISILGVIVIIGLVGFYFHKKRDWNPPWLQKLLFKIKVLRAVYIK